MLTPETSKVAGMDGSAASKPVAEVHVRRGARAYRQSCPNWSLRVANVEGKSIVSPPACGYTSTPVARAC